MQPGCNAARMHPLWANSVSIWNYEITAYLLECCHVRLCLHWLRDTQAGSLADVQNIMYNICELFELCTKARCSFYHQVPMLWTCWNTVMKANQQQTNYFCYQPAILARIIKGWFDRHWTIGYVPACMYTCVWYFLYLFMVCSLSFSLSFSIRLIRELFSFSPKHLWFVGVSECDSGRVTEHSPRAKQTAVPYG